MPLRLEPGRVARGVALHGARMLILGGVLFLLARQGADRCLDRTGAAVFGARYSWESATDQFMAAIHGATRRSAPERELEPA